MDEEFETFYRAMSSRDSRFDGRFFTAVTSTGIYCRPVCPARTPARHRVRFFRVAAAAEAAGFRACRRCRPDLAPGSPEWNVRADLAARALRLIATGSADEDGVGGVARRLHISERHLHRLLLAEVGVGPQALARTRRAQTARALVESTSLPISDVAFAAGYSSIRQFNDSMRAAFGQSPTDLRRVASGGNDESSDDLGRARSGGSGWLTVRLGYREPLDWPALLGWFGPRAVPTLEHVGRHEYARTLRLSRGSGAIRVAWNEHDGAGRSVAGRGRLAVAVNVDDLRDVAGAVRACQHLFDLDADPDAVATVLSADPALAPLVAAHPGLRVPGAADGFELAVRAVIGQQVSVAAARTFLTRLVTTFGEPRPGSEEPAGEGEVAERSPRQVGWLFPLPERLAEADLTTLGLTGRRARTVRALAETVARGDLVLDRGADRDQAREALLGIPGIGAWTAEYVALRSLADPDAFPVTDLGLRRAATRLSLPERPAELTEHAERWRPWRGYAAMHLWQRDATPDLTAPAEAEAS